MEEVSSTADFAEVIEQIDEFVAGDKVSEADQIIDSLSPSDRLIVLSRLSRDTRRRLFLGLSAEKAADYLHDIPDVQARTLLEGISPGNAVEILEELPQSEQADLVGEMSQDTRDSILARMDSDAAANVRDLIEYDDDEAGGMMFVEFVAVSSNLTVGQVTTILQRDAEQISDYDVQYIYVVEHDSNRLVGVLRLRDLLFSSPAQPVRQLMIPEPLSVRASEPLKDLHQFFEDHSFVGVPVVDDHDRLLGVLRRTDGLPPFSVPAVMRVRVG